MKKITIISILFLNYFNAVSQNTKESKEFVALFPEISLPTTTESMSALFEKQFDIGKPEKYIIPQEYIKKYICDIDNTCFEDENAEGIMYTRFFKVSSDNHIKIFVAESNGFNGKMFMFTFSKPNFIRISKLLVAYDTRNLSKINSNITTDKVDIEYVIKTEDVEQELKDYKDYLFVLHKKESYLINKNGHISIDKQPKQKKYLAKYNQNTDKVEFPAILPK
jgi:hypothetical protein